MEQVKQIMKGIFVGMAIYVVGVALLGMFFSQDLLSYLLGLLLGTMVAVFLVFHMTKTLDKALDLFETQATKYMRKQSFLRLFVMMVTMVLGLVFPYFNFIAVVLGLLGVKIGALLAPFYLRKTDPTFSGAEEEE